MSNGVVQQLCPKDRKRSVSEWLVAAVSLLQESGILQPATDSPILQFQHPAALQTSLDLTLREEPADDGQVAELCEAVVRRSVATAHAHFHNQLYGGSDPYGLVGAVITEALNTNQVTFEVAPVFTLVEHEVLNKLISMIAYTNGDGLFSPGGSLSNMYGMMLARHRLSPEAKSKGLYCLKTLVAFTSQDAHYSISKGVNWLGIGTDNLIKVKADFNGRMVPEELNAEIEKAKRDGKLPFFVNATAGTTVLGAFDPIGKIADVCEKHNVWLHVDASWGGSFLFSKKHRHLLQDLHRADSISWNPHKMLGAPLQCSAFLTKHKGLLHQCNCAAATYLFQQDKFYDVSYDTGDKSLQCGRKVDAFKLWLMWKARGESGFGQLVDKAMDCSQYFKNQIKDRPGFRLVTDDFDCTNVCFWYIPKKLRGLEETQNWWDEVSVVAPTIKEKLVLAGTLMIGYQPLNHRNLKNFFRLVNTCHPERTTEDMDHVITQIELYGQDV